MLQQRRMRLRARCSKKALVAIMRSIPGAISQKRKAMKVARSVKPASARAPAQRRKPEITMAEAVSSKTMTATAKKAAG